VGSTPCRTAPRMLKTSPRSQTMRKARERPEAEERRAFSMIWGVKTTIQQAMEMELGGDVRVCRCCRGGN